jgi:polyhydroxybutyrate depolymerase
MVDVDRTFRHGGRTRTATLYLPKGHNVTKNIPLVVLLHGGNGTGTRVLDQTGFRAGADSSGMIVIAPDGIENNWNDGRGTTDAELLGVDDVGFIRSMVSELQSEYLTSDVYAAGVSNGGIMCFRLASEASDVFSAVGAVVASMASAISGSAAPSDPVGLVCIQGTEDPFIPIDGGDTAHSRFPSLGDGGLVDGSEDTRKLWAYLNGCNLNAKVRRPTAVEDDGTSVTRYVHGDGRDGVHVEYHIVEGMGHCWPSYPPTSKVISGSTSGNIFATPTICDFFARHRR